MKYKTAVIRITEIRRHTLTVQVEPDQTLQGLEWFIYNRAMTRAIELAQHHAEPRYVVSADWTDDTDDLSENVLAIGQLFE